MDWLQHKDFKLWVLKRRMYGATITLSWISLLCCGVYVLWDVLK